MNRVIAMHIATDFAPVFAFFITAKFSSFYTAVAVLMMITSASLIVAWIYERRVAILPIISAALVIIAGTITLLYHTPDAVIFGDTLYYLIFTFIIGYGYFWKWNFLYFVLKHSLAITERGWRILALRWAIVFFIAGTANEYVRIHYSPDAWVDFKFYKMIALCIFACSQLFLLRAYRITKESNSWGLRTNHYHTIEKLPRT